MEPEIAFGMVLRTRRKSARLSQEKLALDVGLERTYVSMLERGLRQPTITTLLKLAPALGCTAAELVSDVETALRDSQASR